MRQDNPEYPYLRHAVEQKWGRRLSTTRDFHALSEEMDEKVSPSTLKRFWGYVEENPDPRTSTLDALASYVGFLSFKAFRDNLLNSGRLSSIYFQAESVEAASLSVGNKIKIGWRPDRRVLLEYEGGSVFKVLESENSQLRAGDRFEAASIMKGYPLALSGILRNGTKTDPYVAGLDGGIAYIDEEK